MISCDLFRARYMELSDRQHTLETEIHKTLQRDPNSEYNNSITIVY